MMIHGHIQSFRALWRCVMLCVTKVSFRQSQIVKRSGNQRLWESHSTVWMQDIYNILPTAACNPNNLESSNARQLSLGRYAFIYCSERMVWTLCLCQISNPKEEVPAQIASNGGVQFALILAAIAKIFFGSYDMLWWARQLWSLFLHRLCGLSHSLLTFNGLHPRWFRPWLISRTMKPSKSGRLGRPIPLSL